MVWDTARTWPYSILCAFLLLWIEVENRPEPPRTSQFVRLVALAALLVNCDCGDAADGWSEEHFDVATRVWLYAPVFAVGVGLARQSPPRASGEPGRPLVT